MVAFGAKEGGNQVPSTSSFTPFKTSNGQAPPPLANSTPKKSKLANGLENSESSRVSLPGDQEKSNATLTNGKKRKIAYMDEDEDRGQSLSLNALQQNGEKEGKKAGKLEVNGKAKLQKIAAQLQEQRRNLPIAKGV